MIRTRRLAMGKSQRQVAEAIGIKSSDFICLVEKGRRGLHLDHIPQLAQVLEVDPAELCRLALEARAPQLAAVIFAAAPAVAEVQQ
jgi:transcriptional regulator with XRE-family HTH domain